MNNQNSREAVYLTLWTLAVAPIVTSIGLALVAGVLAW